MKRKIFLTFMLLLLIVSNFTVFAAESKTIDIGNVTVTSTIGNNLSDYISINAEGRISSIDLSNLSFTKDVAANLVFYYYNGTNYLPVATQNITLNSSTGATYTLNSTLKDNKVSHFKIGVNAYTPVYTVTFGGTIGFSSDDFQTVPDEPPIETETFKFVKSISDYDNNIFKFLFNKEFTINSSDIEFKNSKGDLVEFTHSITNNELIITPNAKLNSGSYTITVKKVTSIDNEELTNVPKLSLLIKSNFYLTGKDFNSFISPETTELNLSFNKNLVVNTLLMGNLTLTKTVDGKNLKINLPTLESEIDYPLTLKVTSVDNEILELSYSLSTKSITGNKDIDKLLYPILTMYEQAKDNGVLIIIGATGIGVIFITSEWLWSLAKEWLKSAK